MKRKELEWKLGELRTFEEPKIKHEQYATGAELAASIVHTASVNGHIEGRLVADLGCGCGTLGIAAALQGALCVVGYDCDLDALEICQSNMYELEIEQMQLVQADVTQFILEPSTANIDHDHIKYKYDTVIMNPPFGTKKQTGVDMQFLSAALSLAPVVYSLHKTSTRKHVLSVGERLGAKSSVLAQLRFDIPMTYKFHKLESADVAVDLYQFIKRKPKLT